MNRTKALCIAALVVTAPLACSSGSTGSPTTSASSIPTAPAPAPPDSVRPLTQAELPTTDGRITADNLSAVVLSAEQRVARGEDADALATLFEVVSERQRFTSSVADLRRLVDLGDRIVAAAPKAAKSFVVRASSRAAVHRFKDAKDDVATAVSLGAQDAQVDGLRAVLVQAEGDLEGALALRHKMREATSDIVTLGAEATILGELGRHDDATALFDRAAREYRGVSAPAVAWLYFQEGAMWERAGNVPRARAFYQAAYERLPIYAHAASHFALLEKTERALQVLGPIVAASDDPEFEWAFAQILRRNKRDADADAHLAKARARYDEITALLPEAYAEHAANFWVADGADPAKALLWAKKNLEVRRSPAAFEVAFLAAITSKSTADGCAFKAELDKLPHPSESLRAIAKDACP